MFSKLLALPFVLILGYTVYITMVDNNWYSLYIIPPVIILAVIYVFSNELDWWWHKRNTPQLPEKLIKFLELNGLWYQFLSAEERSIFNKRLSLYLLGIDFKEMNPVPEKQQFRLTAAYFPVLFSLHKDNFLLEPFERLVFYNHAFPTPLNNNLHHSETNREDAVVIFNKKSLLASFGKEKQVFSVAMYEFAKVMMFVYPEVQRMLEPYTWEMLEPIANPDSDRIKQTFGYKKLDEQAVFFMSFWLYPAKCQAAYPDLYKELTGFFKHSFFENLQRVEATTSEAES